MMRRLVSLGLIALCLSVGALAPATGAAAPTAPVVPPAVYVSDVNAAANALNRFGTILKNASDLPALRRKHTTIRTQLRNFDRRIYAMSRYRLVDPALNRQRGRIAVTGSTLSVTYSDFVDAALLGDAAEVQRLVPVIQRKTAAFESAATSS